MTKVDVQFVPHRFDWPQLRDWALEAEARGFDAVWVVDHLAGRPMESEEMYECFTWLGALAASTSRIALGALVANVWNRNPGPTVVGAATVAAISGRPFFFGVGAGTAPQSRYAWEQDRTGARVEPDLAVRHQRVIDVLELAGSLWDTEGHTFLRRGSRLQTIVGVNTIRLARIAGAHAHGVNVWWRHPRRDALLAAARAAVAPSKPFQLTTWVSWEPGLEDAGHPERRAMAAAGISRVILSARGPVPAPT